MDDKTMQWISVKDELPDLFDDDKLFLVYDMEGDYDIVYGSVVILQRDFFTHWMPLPPPPATSTGKAKEGE